MTLEQLLGTIATSPEQVEFSDVIAVIDKYYEYFPTRFHNGLNEDKFTNEAGSNEGSCKIFAFCKDQNLDSASTLNCFGTYYRDDVLMHPQNTDHANIRTFIKYSWEGIEFDAVALKSK